MIKWVLRQYYYIRVQTSLFGWRWILGDRSQKPDMVKYRKFIQPWHRRYPFG